MPSSVLGGLLRTGLSAAVVSAAPLFLLGQTVSWNPQAAASTNQPFSIIDDSLIKAADTLLAPPHQFGVVVASMATGDAMLNTVHDIRIDPQARPLLDSSFAIAAGRLDLLRPTIDPILRNRGVPANLAAVIVVESGGRSSALSPKGARGLWQLMPETARRYGLRVDENQDDRVDLFKSTDAAARYLHDLYAQFGDWKLALAAYNTGEANVGSAILKAHTQDFDQLTNMRMLPLETRNYVPHVLATAQWLGQSLTLEEAHRPASAITVFAVSNR